MSLSGHGLTPRLKPLSARKSAILSVLDVGTSKVVCVVAELKPADEVESLRSRTHVARILGIGHQRRVAGDEDLRISGQRQIGGDLHPAGAVALGLEP